MANPACRRSTSLAFVVLLTLFGLCLPATAQQITYEYDALGRLIVVTTPEGIAQYEYDAVGNILRITTHRYAEVSGPVAILMVNPAKGAPGTTVHLYGRGFATAPGDNRMAFNGTPAVVTAATAGSLTTTVPPGATTGPITLTASLGTATSPDAFVVLGAFTVTPSQAEVAAGESFPFQALLDGVVTPDVIWQVNGIPGGNAWLGTITAAGVYRSPQVQGEQIVTVQALMIADPTRVATASVRLGQPGLLATAPVSVAVTQPPPSGNTHTLAVPVSVAVTQPPPSGNTHTLAVPVSVAVTSPLTGNVVAVSALASVSAGPVVTGVTPATGGVDRIVGLTLTGQNLQGATAVRFFRNGSLDTTLTPASVITAGDGTSVTCNVTISGAASQGVRVVQVISPQGTSSAVDVGVNEFSVTP